MIQFHEIFTKVDFSDLRTVNFFRENEFIHKDLVQMLHLSYQLTFD